MLRVPLVLLLNLALDLEHQVHRIIYCNMHIRLLVDKLLLGMELRLLLDQRMLDLDLELIDLALCLDLVLAFKMEFHLEMSMTRRASPIDTPGRVQSGRSGLYQCLSSGPGVLRQVRELFLVFKGYAHHPG